MSTIYGLREICIERKNSHIQNEEEIVRIIRMKPECSSYDMNSAWQLFHELGEQTLHDDFRQFARSVLKQIILTFEPVWYNLFPLGHAIVMKAVNQNIRQCFREAGLLVAFPENEIINWWDELAGRIRTKQDKIKLEVGRDGERLSYEYETSRLESEGISKLPIWMALANNTIGYDIKSYNKSDYGLVNKLIEVKSCSTDDITIYLTRHEWKKATEYKEKYYFHIWHVPTKTLVCELTMEEMKPYILDSKEYTEWTTLAISFKNIWESKRKEL